MIKSSVEISDTTMNNSNGPGTRGLICTECDSVNIRGGSQFESLTNSKTGDSGAAISLTNTCNTNITKDVTFNNIEADKGPAIFAKDSQI